jgi:hypothetical protein
MVTAHERKLLKALIRIKAFHLYQHMRCVRIGAHPRFKFILAWMLRRQVVDDWHHAPACPANHWHNMTLVLQRCTCGAAKHKIK